MDKHNDLNCENNQAINNENQSQNLDDEITTINDQSCDEVTKSENKINELEKKIEELKDLYVRSQAEIANTQRRSQDEIKKARDFSISSFAKELVVVKDYLEMALLDQSGSFENLKMGVDLTLKQLIQVFEKQQIKEIAPEKNAKLDPNLHQAVNSIEDSGQESNTIVSIMQKGYKLNDRILRPAMVTVAK